MAKESSIFPIFLTARYNDDGAFSRFESEAGRAALRAGQAMGAAFDNVGDRVQKALSIPRTALGGLDLQSGKLREAADAAAAQATALREVARVAKQVAASDPSPAFIRQAREASAAATSMEQFSRATAQEALALDRLEQELARTSIGTQQLASAQKGFTGTLGAQRQAYIGAGQQLQDLVISIGSGQRASTVFAQQLPQLAFALSNVGGATGRIATLLSGPWGIALAGAAFALGPLIDNLFKSSDAADEAGDAASDFAERQLDLGNFIDRTSGKLIEQNAILRENAVLLRQGEITKKQNAILDRRETAFDIASRAAGSGVTQSLTGREGVTVAQKPDGAISAAISRANGNAFQLQRELTALNNPKLKGVIQQIGTLNAQSILSARDIKKLGLENIAISGGPVDSSLFKPKKERVSRGRKGDGGAAALTEFGEDAGKKIANIADSFGDAPNAIQKVNAALRELDDIQSDLERRKPEGFTKLLGDIANARLVVGSSLSRQFDAIIEKDGERARIQQLINTGREREAEILESLASLGDLDVRRQVEKLNETAKVSTEILATEDATTEERTKATEALAQANAELAKLNPLAQKQLEWATRTADQRERDTEATRRRNAEIQRLSSVIQGTQSSLENLFAGGKAKDFFSDIRSQFNQLRAQTTVDRLFGGSLRALDREIRKNDPLNREIGNFVDEAAKGRKAITSHADALVAATNKIAGTSNPANDNLASEANPYGLIKVDGARKIQTDLSTKSINSFTQQWADSITQPLVNELDRLLGVNFFRNMSGTLSGVLVGYAQAGQFGAGVNLANSLLGGKGKIGGVISTISENLPAIGQAIQINQSLNTLFGNDQRKGGKLLHTALGPIASLLFKKKSGSTSLSSIDADLSYSGSGSYRQGVLGLGGNVQSSLANIIETLGGTAGSFGVSIGQRGKAFTVDPTGKGRTKGSGVQKFKTEEEATRAALLDAIADGAVQGIREGAQRLLRAGKDLEKQLSKAADFQSVFDRLRERDDPTGAAIDRLDREFGRLRNIFAEAGASAAEYAELERLYGLERADAIKEANERVTSSLKGLYDELTAANDNRSLKERQAFALAQYDPLKARVAAGDKTAYDEFADVARTLLDIERQIFGSQSGYFSRLDEITGLTKSRIDAESNVALLAQNNAGIFGSTANDSGAVVGAITGLNQSLLAALNQANLINSQNGALLQQIAGVGRSTGYALAGNTYF